MPKIVFFVSNTMACHCMYNEFIHKNSDIISAIIEFPVVPRTGDPTVKFNLFKKILSSSKWFLIFNFLTTYFYSFTTAFKKNSFKRIAGNYGIEYLSYGKIDENLLEDISELSPTYIINGSSIILKKNILNIPRFGTLNYHCAPLPEFKGAANYFWMKMLGVNEAWATLHYVNDELDAGPIICRSEVLDISNLSVFEVWYKLRKLCCSVLEKQLVYIQESRLIPSTEQPACQNISRSFPKRNDVKMLRDRGVSILSLKDFFTIVIF